ncbi:MAG: hypothetical protein KC776_30775 [Myxococcales bacterium]|nr:hypothetical protein [Myxococcales bacterium]MCB9581846.1 hypothetical protein [Polyangiaceae bacterium]
MSAPISGAAGAEARMQIVTDAADSAQSAAPAAPAERTGPSFGKVLERLGHEVDRGEGIVNRAVHGGGHMDARGLIALQAGIYRYTEAVELCSKLVDRAGSAVRTTLQGSGG